MRFNALALFLLAGLAIAEHHCNSDCRPGTTSDCRAALNKMTNTGNLDSNDNGSWSSGDCEIQWIPNGAEADAATAHGIAEDLINTCCAGDKCAGTSVAFSIHTGCICIHEDGKRPCLCGGTHNTMNCLG
ncbi:hypothetical protein BDW62DRAFT_202843 [Aspergillus aurantiobrunneus]